MAKGSNKVQEPEKSVKKKSWKLRVKKDAAHNLPGQDKVKKKTNPKNNVHNPLDRIRHTEPQKGLQQNFPFHRLFGRCYVYCSVRVCVVLLLIFAAFHPYSLVDYRMHS